MAQTFQKDFDAWAKVAQRVEQHSYPTHLKIGAIYWCHLGATIGSELLGKGPDFTRPVFIQTFIHVKSRVLKLFKSYFYKN